MQSETLSLYDLDRVISRVREVVRDVIAPEAERVDREGQWPENGLRALQAAGLGGLVVPQDYGGLGFGLLGLIRVCEEIGRACPATAICFGMHCVGSAVISAKATQDQGRRYLEPIVRGEHFTTLALSEPGTGAHFYFPQTELAGMPDGSYRIRGTKSFVTNGGYADSYVVSTVAVGTGRPAGEFSTVLLTKDTPGMEWGPPWHGFGMRGNASRVLRLNDVVLPADDLLGEEGEQIWYIFNVVAPFFLTAMAGTYLGAAATALDDAIQHMKQRTYSHSGQSLDQLPVLQHRIGTLWSRVERTRRMVYFAGMEADEGGLDALPAIISAKAEVADCAVGVVNDVMTLMGGRAYADDSRIARLLRDVRAAEVMAPTTDILRTWAGRVLLDLPILGD